MAVPGQITLNSLTPGVASLTANYTNPSPGDTDRIYLQIRLNGTTPWVTVEIFDNSTFTVWDLDSTTAYDVRLRAINDTDGFGPWSNTLTQTTLTDSFGPSLVAWDEDGVVPGPFVNNTGSLGAPYNLDTVIGNGANLSNQVRNGRNVWQSSGAAGLRPASTPPSPAISQPCTIYFALVPFFVDTNFRYILRGGFADVEIRLRNDGFALSSAGNGIFLVGSPQTDGRLYVGECVINNTASSIRILDDLGNDTGLVGGNLQYGGTISPESVAVDFSNSPGEDLAAQYMEIAIYSGVGTTAERNARIQELFQKFELNAPNIIEYSTAEVVSGSADTTTGTEGTVELRTAIGSTTEDVTSGISVSLEIGAAVGVTLDNVVMDAAGTVEPPPMPPPPPILVPQDPNFLEIYEHLLPVGEAFKLQ